MILTIDKNVNLKYQKKQFVYKFRNLKLKVKRVAKKVMLVFAIITMVFGAILMTGWTIILLIDIALKESFPGTSMNQEGIVSFYLLLSFGVILIAASILLFVARAKRKE